MTEMQHASNSCDLEVLKKVEMVKSYFKKSGVWSSKKLVKYVPQRLKEVIITIFVIPPSFDIVIIKYFALEQRKNVYYIDQIMYR